MHKMRSAPLALAALLATGLLRAHAATTTFEPPTPTAFLDHPFQASILASANNSYAVGPGAAPPMGVTSITIANQGSSAVQLDMFQASTSGAKCTGTVNSIGGSPDTYVMVPPFATLQLQYPTALVITHLDGQSCLGFDAVTGLSSGNSLAIVVSGYQN